MSNLVEFTHTHTQGGMNNVKAMLQIITQKYLLDNPRGNKDALSTIESLPVPQLEVTPDIGLLHPLLVNEDGTRKYALNPKECKIMNCYSCSIQYYNVGSQTCGFLSLHRQFQDLHWRLSSQCAALAKRQKFALAPPDAPRIAILLYRKHVITNQRYIQDLIQIFESQGLLPVPVFINGVEAHTIVRDWLTSHHEEEGVKNGSIVRDSTFKSGEAVVVDGIVSSIGFPLVGGPAGSVSIVFTS
jgi:magnesium chelatase subunit H